MRDGYKLNNPGQRVYVYESAGHLNQFNFDAYTVSVENFVNFVVFADATIPQNLTLGQ